MFLLLLLFFCSYVVEEKMGKNLERDKRKGKPYATMKGPYLWV
jgi:hypothetical protein